MALPDTNCLQGLLPQQLPAAGAGPQHCLSTAFTDNALRVLDIQANTRLTQYFREILTGLGRIVVDDDPGYVVTQLVEDLCMRISSEGGSCNFASHELQAIVAMKDDFKETVCITTKALNRNPALLDRHSDAVMLKVVKKMLSLLLGAIVRTHTSAFNPFHASAVTPADLAGFRTRAFGAVNRGTMAATQVISEAVAFVRNAGFVPNVLVVTPAVDVLLESGDAMALSSIFVANGFLSQTTTRTARSFAALAKITSSGDCDDPLRAIVAAPDHFVNTAAVCGAGSREIHIYNHDTNAVEPVDLVAAIEALGVFGPDGLVGGVVDELVAEYNANAGRTRWYEDNELVYDPVGPNGTFGVLTYRDEEGRLAVTRVFGHMEMKRKTLASFAESVLNRLGPNRANVASRLNRLEAVLRDIHRQTPPAAYWTALVAANDDNLAATNENEAGVRADVAGNAYGVLDHPAYLTPAVAANAQYANVFAGYGSGPGLAYLASLGRNGNNRRLEEIAEIVDAAELLGSELATIIPSYFTRRPAWYHGDYTPGMALIDILIAGAVPLLQAELDADDLPTFPALGGAPTDAQVQTYLSNVAAVLDGSRNVQADRTTAAATQTRLIALVAGGNVTTDQVLPLLNEISALAGAGGLWAGVASLDVRAATVFAGQPADRQQALSRALFAMLELVDNWPASSVYEINVAAIPADFIAPARALVQRTAAAVAQGLLPIEQVDGAWRVKEDLATWFMTNAPDEEAAEQILAARQLGGLRTAAARLRLPLVLAGRSLTGANLPGTVVAANASAPWTAVGNDGNDNWAFGTTPIGAVLGAGGQGPSAATAPAALRVAEANGPPVLVENMRAATRLPTAAKIVARALLSTPVTADSLAGLVGAHGIDYPFAFLLQRAPTFMHADHAIVAQGGGDTMAVHHDPIQVIEGHDKCASEWAGNVLLSATGVVTEPASTILIPYFYLSKPVKGTADVSFRTPGGTGAIVPSLVPYDFQCPDALPLNGLDASGRLVNPAAIVSNTVCPLSRFAPREYMWDPTYASYQGHQVVAGPYGGPRTVVSAGPRAFE